LDGKKDGEVSQHAIDKDNGYAPESNYINQEFGESEEHF